MSEMPKQLQIEALSQRFLFSSNRTSTDVITCIGSSARRRTQRPPAHRGPSKELSGGHFYKLGLSDCKEPLVTSVESLDRPLHVYKPTATTC